ncbi:type I CRISPR-associated protein Cas7 [Spirosoma sp. KUDC1026]|uniref:type I CRISPR-associated protein Cas7 n=1 Tax=Spirosoma sp. KUDC1026 TaxID=2745947 RepID=UPI00159BEA3A|nr:type I CRISPR-associated protein Cas7 [Spirosoma sp. KUDC1026]QKZ14676.1 type I CRISPR-associated protein Cas7 [Spirosoma sp. KUDC1026]
MSTIFPNRVFGCVIIKSVNSNYNADFTSQPRRLPDGTVYATDKALKYTVRNYWDKFYSKEAKVLYFKRLNANLNPYDLDEAYGTLFPDDKVGKDKKKTLANLLQCLDVKLFGATFANKKKEMALSIHGPLQITHGVDQYRLGNVFSEQIMSPFRDDKASKTGESVESGASTLGTQSKLSEGHYVHGLSLNPHNISDLIKLSGGQTITDDDITKVKKALTQGATLYDSAAKSGTENELMLWVQLKPESMLVLPSFVELISVDADRVIHLEKVTEILERPTVSEHIERIELYFDKTATQITGTPTNATIQELNQ